MERVFSISDAPMFERVMSDEGICKAVVETILDVELVGIKYHETEHSIEPRFGRRGVRLDAYLKDGSSVYDIEMQSYYQESLGRRFRYYQSAIDTELLGKGQEYTLLPESFIIFICADDPFGFGLPRYGIERSCEENPAVDVACGAHWLVLNARSYSDVPRKSLRNLLEYIDRGVVNRDPYATPRIIHDTFVHAISHAQKQILIINPYFTLCRHIKRALKKAVKRGVDVQVMVSQKSDIPITPRVVEYNAHRLMKAGANIYFFTGGFHHSKIMMVDSLYSFVGSANLNSRSLSFDYECNLLVADRYTTQQLQEIFVHDRDTRCFKLTPEVWKHWGRWKKTKCWIFHFLTPFVKCDKKEGDNSGLGDYVMNEMQNENSK